ncbi:hypothetical protein ABID70_002699 [Clavibacter michiganensis]|uniref:hypothetical protein n=1 Tax=Clavibacter michiganensis TaxID=28447 RepID=UPI001AE8F716|nr:hypothetical protein [Clavibacter michiganensis]MBP2457174.1 hypothetical protein [Clavibacter michiganensis]MDQ0409744.1 hypothetical protein [Clavibacter michiganensis]
MTDEPSGAATPGASSTGTPYGPAAPDAGAGAATRPVPPTVSAEPTDPVPPTDPAPPATPGRLRRRLVLVAVVAAVLVGILAVGGTWILGSLAHLGDRRPPVTSAAGTLADPVPVGESWLTRPEIGPRWEVSVGQPDLDSDAAPAGALADGERLVAVAVTITGRSPGPEPVHGVDLAFRSPDGSVVDSSSTGDWAPRPRISRLPTLYPGSSTTVEVMLAVPAGSVEGGVLLLTTYTEDDPAAFAIR